MKEKTLLEKAKSRTHGRGRRPRLITAEEEDLALAWLRREIGMTDAATAYGYKITANVGYRLLQVVRHMVEKGRVVILPEELSK